MLVRLTHRRGRSGDRETALARIQLHTCALQSSPGPVLQAAFAAAELDMEAGAGARLGPAAVVTLFFLQSPPPEPGPSAAAAAAASAVASLLQLYDAQQPRAETEPEAPPVAQGLDPSNPFARL